MIRFIEKTDKGLLVISPMRLASPIRFCAKTKQQTDKAKKIELLVLCLLLAYGFKMYMGEFDGLSLLFWGCIAQIATYLGIWWFVSDLEIYDKTIHGDLPT